MTKCLQLRAIYLLGSFLFKGQENSWLLFKKIPLCSYSLFIEVIVSLGVVDASVSGCVCGFEMVLLACRLLLHHLRGHLQGWVDPGPSLRLRFLCGQVDK